MPDEPADRVAPRRALFRLGLKRLMEPVAGFIQDRIDLSPGPARTFLRPPGALPEEAFLAACYRCGNCVDVCPARAIRTSASDDPQQAGTPYIDPDLAACVVCESLACMKACPSGALKLVPEVAQIHMGLARVHVHTCVRARGEACSLCVEKCPIGSTAIRIAEGGEIEVIADGCVGCGVCQFYCPTLPKSIVVEPF